MGKQTFSETISSSFIGRRGVFTGLLFSLTLLAMMGFAKESHAAQLATEEWNMVEITLTAGGTYASPYKDVDVEATFTAPDQTTMTMPGFWDGGSTWKIRFAPNQIGNWTYVTSSTNLSDTGLHGQTGTIAVTAYSGTLDSYKHGWALQPSGNSRYITYTDGTPFYWLGYTRWGIFKGEQYDDSNDPRFDSQFKGITDRNVDSGYNIVQTSPFAQIPAGWCFPGEACPWMDDFFNTLNLDYWHDADRKMDYLAQSGLIISFNNPGFSTGFYDAAEVDNYKRITRYILARYGAYPVNWLSGTEVLWTGEYTGNVAAKTIFEQVVNYLHQLDPYDRLNSNMDFWTGSPYGATYNFFSGGWFNYVNNEIGHGLPVNADAWANLYARSPGPIIETEANFEKIGDNPDWYTRHAAWQSQMGGSAGFATSAQGIWYPCWTNTDMHPNCIYSGTEYAWNEAIDFVVTDKQLTYMKQFMTALEWFTLEPAADAIAWNGAPTGTNAYKPGHKSNADRSLIVAYLPKRTAAYTGTLQYLIPGETYSRQWFDPQTGVYTSLPDMQASIGGTVAVPEPPTSDDWVLLVRKTVNSSASASGAPGMPELSDDNGHESGIMDGTYNITMNMWWGNNGTVYKLYENDVLIDTGTLAARSPQSQTFTTSIKGRSNGTYHYYVELINTNGTTRSKVHTVVVTQAAPAVPVLSHNNWDGDGKFEVSMNMWWGTNGTTYRLYENEVLIDTQTLTVGTPGSQSAVTAVAGRTAGVYEYRCELENEAGVTSSRKITVTVKR